MASFENMYAAVFYEFQQKEIAMLKRKIADGLDTRDILGDKVYDVFRFRRQVRNRLLEILTRVRNFGIGQVQDELARQKE